MEIKSFSNIDIIDAVNISDENRVVECLYCCDLMGYALGHIQNKNTCLLTIINSLNSLAVCVKLNLSSLIICDNVNVTPEFIKYAKENNVNVFTSKLNTFDTAKIIDKQL